MNKNMEKCNQDVSTNEEEDVAIKSRNFHQQNVSHVSNVQSEFMKFSKQNAVKKSTLEASNIVAKLGWFCYY